MCCINDIFIVMRSVLTLFCKTVFISEFVIIFTEMQVSAKCVGVSANHLKASYFQHNVCRKY